MGLDDKAAAEVNDAFLRGFVEAGVAGELDDFLEGGLDPERTQRHIDAVMRHTEWPELAPRQDDGGRRVAEMVVGSTHYRASLSEDPLGSPDVHLWLNGVADQDDRDALKQDFAQHGYHLDVLRPQGGPGIAELVFYWLRDDVEHLAFDTFLTLSVQRIVKHFRDKGKRPPDRIVLRARGETDPVLVINVDDQDDDAVSPS
jgi:hypothetical protein